MRERLERNKEKQPLSLIFKQLDSKEKGYIEKSNFKEFLSKQYCYPTDNELLGLIAFFDKADKKKVDFANFSRAL